jgi:hypothetical protein
MRQTVHHIIFYLLIAAAILFHGSIAHAEYRIWTDSQGRQLEAKLIQYAEGIITIQKRSMRQFQLPIEKFSKTDQQFVIFSTLKPKYEEAKKSLEDYLQENGDKARLVSAHEEHVRSIVAYLSALGGFLEEGFGQRGVYPEGAAFITRAHSGMIYFANDWLEQLENSQDSILWKNRDISLGEVLGRTDYIHELFTSLKKSNTYLDGNLGKQFPIKFLPEENHDHRQYYHYFAYFPQNYDSADKVPTLLWLPGQGEFGADINRLLKHDLPKRLQRESDYPFLVISVGNHSGPLENDFLRQIYADVVKRFKVDRDRVILTGMSSGGAATWRWASSEPELFAAAVPVSGVMPHYEIQCLTKLPIWLFNNKQDKAWIQELAIAFLEENNPEFKATIYEDASGHNAWTAAYNDPKLTEWMLQQVRKPVQHPKNPIDALRLDNGLSEPILKNLPSDDFVIMSFDRADHSEKPTIEQLHAKRYGFTEAATANNAIRGLYPYFKQLGEPVARSMVQLVDYYTDKLVFALPVSELRRNEITEPFEFKHFNPSTILSSIYVSRDLSSEAALARVRTMAISMGYQLSGEDRIVYLQPITIDNYVMEVQVGIVKP